MSYTADILSAYNDIKDAGVAITIRKKANSGTYNQNYGINMYADAELDGAIDDIVATLTIKNASAAFYSSGTIWIENEEITYTGVSGSDLTGLTRGSGVSTAASHLDSLPLYLVAQDVDYTTYAVITNYNLSEIDGTFIKQGDKKLLIPAYGLTIVPEIEDKIIFSGSTREWTIKNSQAVEPDEIPIIYKNVMIRG